MLTLAVTFKQRLLHENKIVQYLPNWNAKTLIKVILKNHLKNSTNVLGKNYPDIAYRFFTGS